MAERAYLYRQNFIFYKELLLTSSHRRRGHNVWDNFPTIDFLGHLLATKIKLSLKPLGTRNTFLYQEISLSALLICRLTNQGKDLIRSCLLFPTNCVVFIIHFLFLFLALNLSPLFYSHNGTFVLALTVRQHRKLFSQKLDCHFAGVGTMLAKYPNEHSNSHRPGSGRLRSINTRQGRRSYRLKDVHNKDLSKYELRIFKTNSLESFACIRIFANSSLY